MKKSHKTHANVSFRLHGKIQADKVIGFFLKCTPIRTYTGVLENYIRWSMLTLESEGKQAQERLKSYKSYIEDCIARGKVIYPRKGKYVKLVPLLRVLDELLGSNDLDSVRWLLLAVNTFELARPTKKILNQALLDFIYAMDPKAQIVDMDPKVINSLVKPRNAAEIVAEERSQYPDFPWGQFWEYEASVTESCREITVKTAPQPKLSASLLVKSSASKIRTGHSGDPMKDYKSAPAICMADFDLIMWLLSYLDNQEDDTHYVPKQFADALLRALKLDSAYSYRPAFEVFKDRKAIIDFAEDNLLLFRIFTVVIEASNSIKERIIHKVSYAMQYPLELLHDSAIRIAQQLPGDYSGSHEEGFASLNDYARDKSHDFLADVDATAWTDYLPLCLQYDVVKTHYGQEVADSWVQLMRAPAYTLVEIDGKRQLVRYQLHIGQFMGAYGSWAVANLTHHHLLRFAKHCTTQDHYSVQRDGFKVYAYKLPYWIIGDDEVCADAVCQVKYTTLVSSLGIKVNASKSKIFDRGSNRLLSELAHRQTYDGHEVTRVNPKLVANSFWDYASLQRLLVFIRDRAIVLDESQLISKLRQELSQPRHRFITKFGCKPISKRLIDIGLRIPTCVGGLLPDDTNWNTNIDPLLLIAAVLCTIDSYISVFRPGAPILRDGRQNADDILESMRRLPDCLNVDQTTLARYERRVFADRLNQTFLRNAATQLSTMMHDKLPVILKAVHANYSEIDMEEMKDWILHFTQDLKSTATTPAYLAREYEEVRTREAIVKIKRLDPDRFSSLAVWQDRMLTAYQRSLDRIDYLSGSIFERKSEQEIRQDLQSMYEDLWA